jgi:hypothetical protein
VSGDNPILRQSRPKPGAIPRPPLPASHRLHIKQVVPALRRLLLHHRQIGCRHGFISMSHRIDRVQQLLKMSGVHLFKMLQRPTSAKPAMLKRASNPFPVPSVGGQFCVEEDVAQQVRVLACHAKGRGFNPRRPRAAAYASRRSCKEGMGSDPSESRLRGVSHGPASLGISLEDLPGGATEGG